MERSIFLALALALPWLNPGALAQSAEIRLQDQRKEPLTGATVLLTRLADSMQVFRVSDERGLARFEALNPGLYALQVSFIGYETLDKTLQVREGLSRQTYTLRETGLDLGEVTVTARRPLIRQEEDKTIVDPEPLANISTNTLEILEKTPGVFVDQDGYIYLNSATPAVVYINGREQRMSVQDMATILRSLPPNAIQRIEILRTPSTKFDAASSGGIVNVVLRKGVRIGRTGSVYGGFNQGHYGNRFLGFSLNDHRDRTTYYLNANYNRRDALEELDATRQFGADSALVQTTRSDSPADQGYLGFGLSVQVTPTWELSYDGRLNASLRDPGTYAINRMLDPQMQALSDNRNRVDNRNRLLSTAHDLGFRYKPDSLGTEWDTRFSINHTGSANRQHYLTRFTLPLDFRLDGGGDNTQRRPFYLFQSDLTLPIPDWFKLETGIKGTWQDYRSASDYYFLFQGDRIPDPQRTNAFRFREGIGAAYLQGARSLPGEFLLKAGVRAEYTLMEGRQTIPADTTFRIRRADLFPYVYLSRSLFRIAGYDLRGYLIYRRSINRPGYQDLNPFIRIVDQYLYETGNPALQPQFTDNIEANISFDDTPIFALGRNYTTDIFSSVIYQDPQNENTAVRTVDNVGRNRETYFRLVGALPPGGRYFFVAGGQFNLNEYEGFYEGQPLSFARGSWRFFTFHSLTITPSTRFTLSGFMIWRGQQQFYELETFGQLNAGLNQTFLDKKLQITLNASDILRTMRVQFRLDQGSIQSLGERYSDNQRFGLNVRYQFGIRRREERRPALPLEVE